jgi:hypothetical protein
MSRAARGLPSLLEGGSPRRRTTAACAADGELPPSMTRHPRRSERLEAASTAPATDEQRRPPGARSAPAPLVHPWRSSGLHLRSRCSSVTSAVSAPIETLALRALRMASRSHPRQPMPAATARKAGARSSVGLLVRLRVPVHLATCYCAGAISRSWWAAVKKARRAKWAARRVESATAPSRTYSRTSCRRTASAGEGGWPSSRSSALAAASGPPWACTQSQLQSPQRNGSSPVSPP